MNSAKLPSVRLRHMLDEIDAVLAVTKGLSAEDIMNDYVSAGQSNGQSKSSRRRRKNCPRIRAEEPDVPWASIIAIGNYLRHEYYRIKMDIMHQIAAEHLPQLRIAVARPLERHASGAD